MDKEMKKNFLQISRKYGSVVGLMVVGQTVFAADGIPEQLTGAVTKIYSIFNSDVAKTIFMIAFVVICIGMVTNWNSQDAKRKFIIWLISVVLMMNVATILEWFGWK